MPPGVPRENAKRPETLEKQGVSCILQSLSKPAKMSDMLIPQFSIRWLLALMTVCAVVFSIVGLAVRGTAWAAGVSIGIGSGVILVLVYGLLFAAVWVFSQVMSSLGRRRARSGGSPFRSESAGDGPAPAQKEAPARPILVDGSPFAPARS